MESQEWVVNGHKLLSDKSGNGDRLVIVLPGFSLQGSWAIERYAGILNNATSYGLNFPGFHGSELVGNRISISLIHKWILHILQENSASKINLIGHSFGGRIALLLAKEHPEIIDSITLIAPVTRVSILESWGHLLPEKNLINFINFLSEGNRLINAARSFKKLGFLNNSDLKFLKLQYDSQESIDRMKYYARSIPLLKVSDPTIKQVFGSIDPIDLYLSEKDPHCDYRYWRRMCRGYSNVVVQQLLGGHFGKIIDHMQ